MRFLRGEKRTERSWAAEGGSGDFGRKGYRMEG
jgi:hypothetical protein